MTVPITTIDNFFETPTLVREFALQQEYFKGDRGNWPGFRTKFIDELDSTFFHTFCSKLINYVPGCHAFRTMEAGFQLIDESYGSGWVHDDDDKFNVAGLIYLNPGVIQQGCGTTFYDYRLDVNGEDYSHMFNYEVNSDEYADHNKYQKYRDEHRSKWVPNVTVQNRFNRCNIFNSKIWHSADNFFGNSKETSRLTLVFFGHAV